MWWNKLLLLLAIGSQSFEACFAISQDESVRSYLEHFNTTRNNHVNPALKTKARDFIVKTFQDFGLDTWMEKFQCSTPGINIVGRVNGRYTGTSKDKILIIAAHYDTAEGRNGVDDNGSGMAALLQALSQYKSSNYKKCSQHHTLLFVAFDLKDEISSCRCLCGSKYFVANLTRYVEKIKSTVQGAYIMDGVMNYNTSVDSMSIFPSVEKIIPDQYQWIKKNQFRGDWLAVIGRNNSETALRNKFVSNFKQGPYKTLIIPLPFDGSIRDLDGHKQKQMTLFLSSDHRSFWNSSNSWPAVYLTDTGRLRGYRRSCNNEGCDNMDQVTPEMITFMGRTADALVRAAQSLTERVCPTGNGADGIGIHLMIVWLMAISSLIFI